MADITEREHLNEDMCNVGLENEQWMYNLLEHLQHVEAWNYDLAGFNYVQIGGKIQKFNDNERNPMENIKGIHKCIQGMQGSLDNWQTVKIYLSSVFEEKCWHMVVSSIWYYK